MVDGVARRCDAGGRHRGQFVGIGPVDRVEFVDQRQVTPNEDGTWTATLTIPGTAGTYGVTAECSIAPLTSFRPA